MDEDFNREEKKFGTLERGVRTLVRDVSSYLDQLQVSRDARDAGFLGIWTSSTGFLLVT